MGEVWLARNERTQRDFAIKIMLPGLVSSPEAVRRFVQEARATGRIHHPSIVEVFDAGKTSDGRPYLVMELLRGESLEDRLRRVGGLTEVELCILLSQVAAALALAHEAGLVHRDLSGSNIFLAKSADGDVEIPKILDFGVSKILDGSPSRTIHGALLGSPAYMSPEQAEGAEGVDSRTDIWSLGVLAYQALSGRFPFGGRTTSAVMMGVLTKNHRPLISVLPTVDPELARLVEACLVKDRERRLCTAAALAVGLQDIALRLSAGEAWPMTPRRPADRLALPADRKVKERFKHSVSLWVAGPAVLAGLLGTALGYWSGHGKGQPGVNERGASVPVAQVGSNSSHAHPLTGIPSGALAAATPVPLVPSGACSFPAPSPSAAPSDLQDALALRAKGRGRR